MEFLLQVSRVAGGSSVGTASNPERLDYNLGGVDFIMCTEQPAGAALTNDSNSDLGGCGCSVESTVTNDDSSVM